MRDLRGLTLVHLTTADISLALLLGPQLRAYRDAGMHVIGVSAPGPFVPEIESWGIRHVPMEHATRSVSPLDDALALPELIRLFRSLRPDIVHTHNPKPGLYGRLAAKAAGVPGIVNTVHGLYAAPEDAWTKKSVVYGLERVAATCSQIELCQNPEDLDVLRHLRVPERRLTLLGNGVDLGRFRPPTDASAHEEARAQLGVEPGKTVVGFVGRLVWGKGLKELFASAAALAQSHPEVVFVLIGPTDDSKGDALTRDELQAAEALGNVILAGHRDEVEALYPAFDVYVLPSYREGFPRSAMEAAACGVPVIATDIRGCRQVVDHGTTGLLVPLHDVAALTTAISDLVDDPTKRAAMAQASRIKAESDFDDRRVIEITLDAYRRLPGRRARSATR